MKVTMKLTLDDLVRAMRTQAHRMADEIESGYARRTRRDETQGAASLDGRDMRAENDGVGGN